MSGNRDWWTEAPGRRTSSEIEAMRAKFQEMRMERMPNKINCGDCTPSQQLPQSGQPRSRIQITAVILNEEQLTLWDPSAKSA